MMSRPVAGIRKKSLILTLPGSPKGAKENLQAVIKLLPHACTQAAGADSRQLHAGGLKKLEAEAGVFSTSGAHKPTTSYGHDGHHHNHSHHHHHGGSHGHVIPQAHTRASTRSNDPNAGPTRRYRESPYPMLSVEEALRVIYDNTPAPVTIEAPVGPSLVGSVIAEDVYAAEAVPAYKASIVDGYAVIASVDGKESTKGRFPVASISHAEAASGPPSLAPGTIARITTGAPLPPNANAVAMVEDTVLVSTTPDGSEEAVVEILTGEIKPGENVREPGSDVSLGSKLLEKGDLINSVGGEIGLLASTGTRTVKVFKKPCIGVLSTGDELVEHEIATELKGGQIRDSNRPSLISCLIAWGFSTIDLGIARDTSGDLEHGLRDAFRHVDIVVTTGGVSMGELDLLKPTIERQLGGTIHFGRVSMKPGKPTTFATVPFKPSIPSTKSTRQVEREAKLIFSLPGNPASALVTLNLFVLPSLYKYAGRGVQAENQSVPTSLGLPIVTATLTHSVRLDPKRTEYHRAILSASKEGVIMATSAGLRGPGAAVGQRSSRVGSLAGANALLVLQPGNGVVEQGKRVQAMVMGDIVGE